MTEILTDVVPEGSSLQEYETTSDLIFTAWNLSLLNGDKRFEANSDLITTLDGSDRVAQRDTQEYIEKLVALKLEMFPYDKRIIVSSEVGFNGGLMHVSAAAIAPNHLCHDLLKYFRREALHRQLGSERVATYFAAALSNARKSRALCDAIALLEFNVRLKYQAA